MNKATCFSAAMLLSAVLVAGAKADAPASPSQTDTDNLSLQDPDGVPLVISHPKPKPQPGQTDEERKKQNAATDKDWLLHEYQQQLQSRTHSSGNDNSNPYSRITSDKGLSQLAGLSTIEPTVQSEPLNLKTGASDSNKNTVSLRADSTSNDKKAPTSLIIPAFKPLITPLGAADAAGLHNFYSSLPASTQPILPATSNPDTSRNPSDFDTPGKVAADSNPLLDKSDNLTFDTLPDENLPSSSAHHGEISSTALPASTNAEQLQKITNTSLNAPGTTKTTSQPTNISALQLKLNDDYRPTKLAPPSPVRQPIASPSFFLDR